MQFEIQGQDYYLKFDPGERRWYLLKPTLNGLSGMAVLDDGGPLPETTLLLPAEQEEKGYIN